MTKRMKVLGLLSLAIGLVGNVANAEEFYKLKESKCPPFENGITVITASNVNKKPKTDRFIIKLNGKNEITKMLKYPGNQTCFGVCYKLKNGNYLSLSHGTVVEMDAEGKFVNDYNPLKVSKKEKGVNWCEKLENGNILLGLSTKVETDTTKKGNDKYTPIGSLKIIEQAPDGKMVKEITLDYKLPKDTPTHQIRDIKHLANGNFLIAHQSGFKVNEYTPDGKLFKTIYDFSIDKDGKKIKKARSPICVDRCENGNTLIGTAEAKNAGIFEIDTNGKIVWQLVKDEMPELELQYITMVKKLKNGNVLVVNNHGHKRTGWKGVGVFEISPDKKIVHAVSDYDLVYGGFWAILEE